MTRQWMVRLIGAGVGLLIGILLLVIGFWKTLLLSVLVTAGWFLSGNQKWCVRFFEWVGKIRRSKGEGD